MTLLDFLKNPKMRGMCFIVQRLAMSFSVYRSRKVSEFHHCFVNLPLIKSMYRFVCFISQSLAFIPFCTKCCEYQNDKTTQRFYTMGQYKWFVLIFRVNIKWFVLIFNNIICMGRHTKMSNTDTTLGYFGVCFE